MPPRLRRRVARDGNSPAPTPAPARAPVLKERLSFAPILNAHTSTPARPINAPRRRTRAPIPVKRTTAAAAVSPLPPSSPPFSLAQGYGLGSEAFEAPAAEVPGDDPFGFLAAERRLKERKRILGQMQVQVKKLPAPPQPSPRDEDKAIYGGNTAMDVENDAPPAPLLSDSDLELDFSTFVSGTQTPPGHTPDPRPVSPRHRRPKRKEIPPSSPASPHSTFESESEPGYVSIPGTPSPMKRLSSSVSIPRHRRRQPFGDVAAAARVNSPLKPAELSKEKKKGETDAKAELPAKRKGKKGGKEGPPRKKNKTDETLAEEELKDVADALKGLLPRRPTRKAAQRKSLQPRDANVQGSAAGTTKTKATGTGKKGKRVQKPRSKKPKAQAAKHENADADEEDLAEKEGESFVLSGEERERFEVDREKRREYFRGVDEYVMCEESVYVI